tara:strand:+ start:7973 stop:8911 length:939 start_codon:yes stop_codon:yes gene_type:complete
MLNEHEKKNILSRFPNLERSYDKSLHNNVQINQCKLFMLVPKGPKTYLWYTYLGASNVCIVMQTNNKGAFSRIEIQPMCFNEEISYGTILYGTLITIGSYEYFTAENILQYCGNYLHKYSIYQKLHILKDMFDTKISQVTYNKRFIIPTIPYLSNNFDDAIKMSTSIKYTVYGIKCFNDKCIGIYHVKKNINNIGIFYISATINSDIYNIYSNSNSEYIGVACISSYKTSVLLNGLFRNIKENINLDLLEESDDEEEFQDISDDKYVDTNKRVIMKCNYNRRFSKWEPFELIEPSSNLSFTSYEQAKQIERQ